MVYIFLIAIYFQNAGVKISLRQIDLLLERLDKDGNGEIEWM